MFRPLNHANHNKHSVIKNTKIHLLVCDVGLLFGHKANKQRMSGVRIVATVANKVYTQKSKRKYVNTITIFAGLSNNKR